MMERSETRSVPPAAKWLGGLGAIPFVLLGLSGLFLNDPLRSWAAFALVAYGAAILSFLGGVRWGLAISEGRGAVDVTVLWSRLTLSIAPALVAWLALLCPVRAGLIALAAGIAWMSWIDLRAANSKEAPAWYSKLRWPLSCVAIVSLLTGALR